MHVLIAETKIQSQTRGDFPVVLHIWLDLREAIPAFAIRVGFLILLEISDQRVGKGITRAVAMTGREVQSAVNGRDVVLVFPAAHGENARLEAVISDQLEKSSFQLKSRLKLLNCRGIAFNPLKPAILRVGISPVIP